MAEVLGWNYQWWVGADSDKRLLQGACFRADGVVLWEQAGRSTDAVCALDQCKQVMPHGEDIGKGAHALVVHVAAARLKRFDARLNPSCAAKATLVQRPCV